MLVSAVALIDVDGSVLLAQRPAGKSMAGLWEFPGGKVEAGETPEAALIRELKEELDIDIRESCLAPLSFVSHSYEKFHLLMPLYICRTWRGKLTPREGQKHRLGARRACATIPCLRPTDRSSRSCRTGCKRKIGVGSEFPRPPYFILRSLCPGCFGSGGLWIL